MYEYHNTFYELLLPALVLIVVFLILAIGSRWSYRIRRILAPASVLLFVALLLLQNKYHLEYFWNPVSIVMLACFLLCVGAVAYQCRKMYLISQKTLKIRSHIEKRTKIANSLVFIVGAALVFICIAISSSSLYAYYGDVNYYKWIESAVKFSLLFTFVIVLTDGYIGQISSPIFTVDIIEGLERFNLYLRSFETDDISAKKEKMLCRSFDRLFPTYAIGNPNAVLQPLGARRIYAADTEWQHVVGTMMDKARIIIIRCAATDGAMWELNRLLSDPALVMKSVFVVDSAESYRMLRDELARKGYDTGTVESEFRGGQYGIIILNGNTLYAAPLNDTGEINTFIKLLTDKREQIKEEYSRLRRMRHMVLFRLYSRDIPEKVCLSLNWSIMSPVVSWRHWPLYYWLFFAVACALWPYAGVWPVVIYLLIMFLIGNQIEWGQRPGAGPVLFLKRQRREAALMWGSVLFTVLCALFAILIHSM